MATTQGIKLDDDTQQRLKNLAEKKQRSPHWLMRTAIEAYLKTEEKFEQEKLEDQQRWENYVDTGNAIEHTEVSKWLDDLSSGKKRKWRQ